jgi:prepilin-type processing-associated H-X9-DG protein
MAMNVWLGGFAGDIIHQPNLVANSKVPLSTWAFYMKYGDLAKGGGGAANIFVFLDMRPDSINTGNFGVCMDGYPTAGAAASPGMYRFWDLPGNQHSGGCGFSYADGHAAMHKWTNPNTTPPYDYKNGVNGIFTSANNADVAALQDMASRSAN